MLVRCFLFYSMSWLNVWLLVGTHPRPVIHSMRGLPVGHGMGWPVDILLLGPGRVDSGAGVVPLVFGWHGGDVRRQMHPRGGVHSWRMWRHRRNAGAARQVCIRRLHGRWRIVVAIETRISPEVAWRRPTPPSHHWRHRLSDLVCESRGIVSIVTSSIVHMETIKIHSIMRRLLLLLGPSQDVLN